jgi:nitroimidazol reductase NimA-like FMN-containing flavoprotein (pyridoxamine 5'-phosphate oxidase superfamily)
MIGAMGSFDYPSTGLDEPLDCYLHGYVSNRLANTVRKAQEEGKPGLPICIAASKLDGVVLALSAFHHSMNYRSAVLFGHVTIVNNLEEKDYAMTIITDKVVKQRWVNSRLPATKAEISSTSILKVKIDSASGKARAEPLGDDKEDLENEDLS